MPPDPLPPPLPDPGRDAPLGLPVVRGNRVVRAGWLVLGLFFVALGIIGAILPLMPTTIFLILAAGCFARSSPRLEAWLLDHPRFGPTLRAWRSDGAIPGRAKIAACSGIGFGFIVFMLTAHPGWRLALSVAAAMATCAAFIVTRPLPGASR